MCVCAMERLAAAQEGGADPSGPSAGVLRAGQLHREGGGGVCSLTLGLQSFCSYLLFKNRF